MNAREHWAAISADLQGIDKSDLATFINTLHTSGLSAARAYLVREEKVALSKALPAAQGLSVLAQTKHMARGAVLLLRRLQANGEK